MQYKYQECHEEFKDADAVDRENRIYRNCDMFLGVGQKHSFDSPPKQWMDSQCQSTLTAKTLDTPITRYKMELDGACSQPIQLPILQEMQISLLKSPFNKTHAIILDTPEGSTEEKCNYARETFGKSYEILQEMAPAVTFKPNPGSLKCKGSFTQDFCTCRFEIQVFRVEDQETKKNVYIFEFRRKTLSGRDAFEYLIRYMAFKLKEAGRAKVFGNGMEIYPPAEIPDALGDLAMPSFGGVGPHTSITHGNPNRGFPITLDEYQMDMWCEIIAKREWPAYEETLRTLARCCCDLENKKKMADNVDLQKVLIKELQNQNGMDATNCHNTLTIVFAILEEASEEESDVDEMILLAVAKTLMSHSSIKQQRSKTVKSVALERAALKILMLMSAKPKEYSGKLIHEVLEVLVGIMSATLNDEISQKHLEYVIGNLRKQLKE